MKNQAISVSIKTRSREAGKEIERIVLSAGGFRFSHPKESPHLLIFELSEAFDEEFKLLESLLASHNVGEIFVTSKNQDTDLLLRAMRTGAKEFLAQPINELDLITALNALKKRFDQAALPDQVHNGKIFHFCGAKGGVGTTTVAVNLAMILSKLRKLGSVALVDLNTVFGEIPLFLSLKPAYHWGQIANNLNRLDSTFLLNAMTKHETGVHILPSPSYLNGHPPATPEIMERLLTTMKQTFDFIIVDGGQSLDGPALKVLEMADKIFMVTLLNLPCLRNTKNLLKSFSGLKTVPQDRLRLVINRHLKKSDITIQDAEKSIQNPIFWNIPNDYKTTMSAINRGIPLYQISPKASITKNLEAFADQLIEPKEAKPANRGWRIFRR